MSEAINNKQDVRKANYWYISNIIFILTNTIIGFLSIKMIINFYGEPINGTSRFIIIFISYFTLIEGAIFIIYSIKIISFYKNNEIQKIIWLSSWLAKYTRIFSVSFLIILIVISVISAYILSSLLLSFNLLFFLFISIGIKIFFDTLFMVRITTIFVATNNGYVITFINIFTRLLITFWFFYIVLFNPPQLQYAKQNDVYILNFVLSDRVKVYALGSAYLLKSCESIIIRLVVYFYTKKNKEYWKILKYERNKKFEKKMKKEILSGVKMGLLMNSAYLLIMSTDEFAITLLTKNNSSDFVLQKISIYTLYFSVINTFKNVVSSYVDSKRILLAKYSSKSEYAMKKLNEIRTNNLLFSAITLIICITITPIIITLFFQPPNSIVKFSYVNINFAIPISIFSFITMVNNPTHLQLKFTGKLKILTISLIIQGIINVILSFGLILVLGIYWILWASVIAACINFLFLEFIIQRRKYNCSQISFKKDIYFWMSILFIIISFVSIVILYNVNYAEILSKIRYINLFLFAIFAIILFYLSLYLYNLWKRKKQQIK